MKLYRMALVLALGLAAPAGADELSSLLSVGLNSQYLGRSETCEEAVAFGPTSLVELELRLVNEDGGRGVMLLAPIEELIRWELHLEGEDVGADVFEVVVAGAPGKFRYDTGGGELDSARFDLLEAGAGLRVPVLLKTRKPLADGLYWLLAFVDEEKIAFDNREKWAGRGLQGGDRFRVIREVSEADRPRQMVAAASALLQKGDPRAAIEILSRLVEMEPRVQGYWDRLGMAHIAARDYQAAVRSFEKIEASGIRDAHSAVRDHMVAAYVATGDRAKAKSVMLQVLPDDLAEDEVRKIEAAFRARSDAAAEKP